MFELALFTILCAAGSSGLAFWLASAAGLKWCGWVIVLMTALSMTLMFTDYHRYGPYVFWSASLVTGVMYWTIWRKRLVRWINPTPKTEAL